MKIRIAILFAFTLSLQACKKVIDLQLKNNEPRYVIEGIITNEPGSAKVFLTLSRNFNDSSAFQTVSGALVTVSDNGTLFTLTESAPGVYSSGSLHGTPGHVYRLTVSVNGQNFTAESTMPQPVILDSLEIARGPFGQFKFPVVTYTDPPGVNNGYRFIQYVNNRKDPAIFWRDDEFEDGQTITLRLDSGVDREDDPRNIRTGDLVTIELLTLDEPILKYWYTIRAGGATGQGNIITPANPVTNLQGNALGYFSAHTVSRKSVIAL
jgi:hypothetical protein